MIKLDRLVNLPGILILVLGLVACSSSSGGGGGGSDTTPPTASFEQTGPLNSGASVVVYFSEGIDDATLVLSGPMAQDAHTLSWNGAFDQLTISPTGTWSTGADRMLTLKANDAAGNPMAASLSGLFDVVSGGFFYVNIAMMDDTGNGLTPATAKKYIQSAIDLAGAGDVVLVAGGSYAVDSTPGTDTQIMLAPGVSLFGGYSQDFTVRDTQLYVTTITDSSTATKMDLYLPNCALQSVAGVTSSTIVDGFTIQGGGGDYSAGILITSSSPIIRGNQINGGTGSFSSAGIVGVTSTAVVERNRIHGGSGMNNMFGLRNFELSKTTIRNNMIFGGDSGLFSHGIENWGASPVIWNNTINGGSGTSYAWGIYSHSTSAPVIENNIVFTDTGYLGICIAEGNDLGDPFSMKNNNLFNCGTYLYAEVMASPPTPCSFNPGYNCYSTIQEVNMLASTDSSGNISVDPGFVDIDGGDDLPATLEDNDWHLTATSPAEVTEGGLNHFHDFRLDYDAVARKGGAMGNPRNFGAAGWSMGAHEYDVVTIPRNFIFTTSTAQTGNLGGLAGADALCEARADAAGLHENTYVAWLSSSTVNAVDRLAGARGWVRTDGRIFADTSSDITAMNIYYAPWLTEFGQNSPEQTSMTGTLQTGLVNDIRHCSDWTADMGSVSGGVPHATSQNWTFFYHASCDTPRPIYCMGIDYDTPVSPPSETGRIAFIHSSSFNTTSGLSGADSQCQANASFYGLPGTYLALLATETDSPASRFDLTGEPWVRTDGVPIVANAEDLDSESLLGPVRLGGDGVTDFGDYGVWTGTNDLSQAGSSSTCSNWTSNDAGESAHFTFGGGTHPALFFAESCDASHLHIICLQE